MKKIAILLLFSFLLSGFPLFSEEEKSWLLQIKPDKALRFHGELCIQARTTMAMMFMPEQEVFIRLSATQDVLLNASEKDGSFTTESEVATASLEQYVAGQPNQKIDDEILHQMLWVSGLGDKGVKISARRSGDGRILKTDGIPEKYAAYYENDLIFFPEKPVKIGESWQKTFNHPIAIDPGQEPVICKVDISYQLKKVDEEKGEIEIDFKMSTAADHIIQNGAKVSADLKLDRNGTMKLSWPLCLPTRTTSKSNFSIMFSQTNFIKSEEEYDSTLTIVEKP